MNKDVKKNVASANLNFLIGAGLSDPFLGVLGDIEKSLTEAEGESESEGRDDSKIALIKGKYFEESIQGNLNILDVNGMDEKCREVLDNYKNFYKNINYLILKRESSLLSKQINIFTTNIDIFSEVALEESGIDFNDGFHGRFDPKYDVGNFKKSYYKTSLHYENTSEIPVFNILKLHGSVSWKGKEGSEDILIDRNLKALKTIKDGVEEACNNDPFDTGFDENFSKNFDKLMIVNPTEQKFEDTILKQTYYDLLRIYSNELEKENSALFVMGFSFADDHIKKLTLRVANSNPTLKIYIFSYEANKSPEYVELEDAKNKNVEIILPEHDKQYDFDSINNFFEYILRYDEEKDAGEQVENK